jgi:hypothetical protein
MRQNIGASNVLCEQVMRGEPKNKSEKFQLFKYLFCEFGSHCIFIFIDAGIQSFRLSGIVPEFGNSGFFPRSLQLSGHSGYPVSLAILRFFSGQCKEKKFKKKKHSGQFSVAGGNGNLGLNQKPHEQMVNNHRIARVSYKIPDPPYFVLLPTYIF